MVHVETLDHHAESLSFLSGSRLSLARMRVLVADDEPGVRGELERALLLDGYDGAAGALSREPPGVVPIDMALSGAGPLAACHALKQLVRSAPVALYGDSAHESARLAGPGEPSAACA